MSCMYDRIMAHEFAMPAWANPLYDYEFRDARTGILDLIRRAKVFVIDDVRDYIFIRSGQATWDLPKDFPNLIPPFALSFFEMHYPRHFPTPSNGKPLLQPPGMDFQSCGVLIRGTRPRWPDPSHTSRVDPSMASSSENSGSGDPEEKIPALMIDVAVLIESRRGHIVGPTVGWQLALDANGTIVGKPGICGIVHVQVAPEDEESYHEWLRSWNRIFFPSLLAISLLNHGNAQAVMEIPPSTRSRAFKRRHGRLLTPFYKVTVTAPNHVLGPNVLAAMPTIRPSSPIACRDSVARSLDYRLPNEQSEIGEENSDRRADCEQGLTLENLTPDLTATELTIGLGVKAV